jgi:multicomponent Na+:H+ antiporter subunit B
MNYNNSSKEKGMTLIVKTITRLTVGLILLYGIYITLHGHISPGGGFAGGVIIALSFIHLVLAYGKEEVLKRISKKAISIFESLGALLFLSIAFLGFVGCYFFLDWLKKGKPFDLFSAGTIPISNFGIGIKVSFGLFGVFLALILAKFIRK